MTPLSQLASSYLTSVAMELELTGTMECDEQLTMHSMELKGRTAKPAKKQRLAQRIVRGYQALGNSIRVRDHPRLLPSAAATSAPAPAPAHLHTCTPAHLHTCTCTYTSSHPGSFRW